MTEFYWITCGLLLFHFGKVVYFYYQKKQNQQAEEEIADTLYGRYLELREETLALKPEYLGIPIPSDKEAAFGVVLEIHTTHAIQAIVAFANGQVWTFNTNVGRKNTNGGDEEDVRAAAIEAVNTAQYHFVRMKRKNADALLPGHLKFHILTNLDVYSMGGLVATMMHEWPEVEELAAKIFALAGKLDDAAKKSPVKRVYTKINVRSSKPANL